MQQKKNTISNLEFSRNQLIIFLVRIKIEKERKIYIILTKNSNRKPNHNIK